MLKNRIRLLNSFLKKETISSGLPVELVIEVTNFCNLNCIMCSRQLMRRPVEHMDFSLYKKIIDEIKNYIELVYLHGLGEPLLHPEIFKMIDYAKEAKIPTGMSTNATILDQAKTEQLLKSNLDYLIISFDGATKETYEKIRKGANFEQTVSNIKYFLKQKKEQKNKPFTVLQFIKMKENAKEADQFLKMWKGVELDAIRIKPVIDFLHRNQKSRKSYTPCFYIWRQLNMITNEGYVTPCCEDAEGRYPLGNVKQNAVWEIWNGPKMRKLRKAQLEGRQDQINICRTCQYPQPRFLSRLGVTLLNDLKTKKLLPFLEKIVGKNLIDYS